MRTSVDGHGCNSRALKNSMLLFSQHIMSAKKSYRFRDGNSIHATMAKAAIFAS